MKPGQTNLVIDLPNSKYNIWQFEMIAEIFKSISFPVRLQILDILSNVDRMTVGQLAEYTSLDHSLLSHHLQKMKHSGVLESVREGRYIFYSLKLKKIISIFHCIDKCEIFNQ